MFHHDPEVPAGYQEADLLQAQYEAESRRAAQLHSQGICTHGWMLGRASNPDKFNATREEIEKDRQRGNFPERPTNSGIRDQLDIPVGQCLCLDCGILVPDPLHGRI